MGSMTSTASSAAATAAGETEMMSGMMTASMMEMVFFSSYSTPIYSSMWMPKTIGQYAGTCIFLIVLAVILRALLALKAWKEAAWMDAEFNRRFVSVVGKPSKAERMSTDSKRMILTENGVEEEVVVVEKSGMSVRPWRISIDPIRAVIDTVIAGVGWLLMLAIMTMNVGYFLSVLGGTFLGSLALGRYNTGSNH